MYILAQIRLHYRNKQGFEHYIERHTYSVDGHVPMYPCISTSIDRARLSTNPVSFALPVLLLPVPLSLLGALHFSERC